jgi:hypothetical protein
MLVCGLIIMVWTNIVLGGRGGVTITSDHGLKKKWLFKIVRQDTFYKRLRILFPWSWYLLCSSLFSYKSIANTYIRYLQQTVRVYIEFIFHTIVPVHRCLCISVFVRLYTFWPLNLTWLIYLALINLQIHYSCRWTISAVKKQFKKNVSIFILVKINSSFGFFSEILDFPQNVGLFMDNLGKTCQEIYG